VRRWLQWVSPVTCVRRRQAYLVASCCVMRAISYAQSVIRYRKVHCLAINIAISGNRYRPYSTAFTSSSHICNNVVFHMRTHSYCILELIQHWLSTKCLCNTRYADTVKDMVSLRLRLVTMDTHCRPTVNNKHPYLHAPAPVHVMLFIY